MRPKDGIRRLARPALSRLARKVDERSAQITSAAVAPLDEHLCKVEALVVTERARLSTERNRLSAAAHRLTTEMSSISGTVESLDRHFPVILNTIASQNAASRDHERRLRAVENEAGALRRQIDTGLSNLAEGASYLEQRLEMIRKEVMFEVRYGPRSTAAEPLQEPETVNPERLEKMAGDICLNLGAGHIALPDHLNVDARQIPGIDIVADVRKLPFGVGEVAEIFSAHFLEHFPVEEMRRSLLPYWVSLLRDGGRFIAVVPDMETMATEFAAGRMPSDEFIEVVYGGQEYEGDFHFAGFTHDSLVSLLESAGLSDVTITEAGRKNGLCYEMQVEAVHRYLGKGKHEDGLEI